MFGVDFGGGGMLMVFRVFLIVGCIVVVCARCCYCLCLLSMLVVVFVY